MNLLFFVLQDDGFRDVFWLGTAPEAENDC